MSNKHTAPFQPSFTDAKETLQNLVSSSKQKGNDKPADAPSRSTAEAPFQRVEGARDAKLSQQEVFPTQPELNEMREDTGVPMNTASFLY